MGISLSGSIIYYIMTIIIITCTQGGVSFAVLFKSRPNLMKTVRE